MRKGALAVARLERRHLVEDDGLEGGPVGVAHLLRARHRRNLIATVLLSQGTPMLLAGDEMGRTQDGNNNAYCQDNGVSWVDWSRLPQERGLVELVGRLARLRGRHALLRRGHFVHGEEQCPVTDFRDIEWLRPGGGPMTEHDWHDPRRDCVGVLLATPAVAGQGDALLVVFNAGDEPTRFALPGGDGFDLVYRGWFCALTTGGAAPVLGKHAEVEARSVSVFEALAHGESP